MPVAGGGGGGEIHWGLIMRASAVILSIVSYSALLRNIWTVETRMIAAHREQYFVLNNEAAHLSSRGSSTSISKYILLSATNDTRIDNRFSDTKGLKQLAAIVFYKSLCGELAPRNSTHIILNVSFGCRDAFTNAWSGTGNFLAILHRLHLIAKSSQNMDMLLTCYDAMETRDKLILPWMMGWFPYSQSNMTSHQKANRNCNAGALGSRWRSIQFDLRRMAIALVGIPSSYHPSAAWAERYIWSTSSPTNEDLHPEGMQLQLPNPTRRDVPLYPRIALDEAVLHFRCGDLTDSDHQSFGFMKFRSFSRHLRPSVRSIGIVTQPFVQNGNSREKDAIGIDRCRKVIAAFTKYLQSQFPKANVTVRNDPNETIALTYSRIVMAKQVVIAMSSLSVYPAIATFGTAYIRRPDYKTAPNKWLIESNVTSLVDNLVLIDEPRLMAAQCQQMWKKDDGEQVLKWFEDYNMPPLGYNEKES